MKNYYSIHKNKKPKKAKYSKPYSKTQLQIMEECVQYFTDKILELKRDNLWKGL